jgi:methylated-DNA-[protein]-cysteine S-methyltransferase
MRKLYLHSFSTPWGTIRTAATEKGLAVIALPGEGRRHFDHRVKTRFADYDIRPPGPTNRRVERQLKQYLSGRRRRFELKLDIGGSPFQKKVLRRVARIPYGQTKSYGDIARAVGQPRAFRAVGSANGRNPLPLVIPCHRVVAANGLGGYGGGLAMKKRLLKMEGAL